ncbi:MAG TPA: hypothetical protein VFF21_08350 [Flavobacteriaceae bacterium]|nr:hypothetical protein [Flavobacteriaceae bacterium]
MLHFLIQSQNVYTVTDAAGDFTLIFIVGFFVKVIIPLLSYVLVIYLAIRFARMLKNITSSLEEIKRKLDEPRRDKFPE